MAMSKQEVDSAKRIKRIANELAPRSPEQRGWPKITGQNPYSPEALSIDELVEGGQIFRYLPTEGKLAILACHRISGVERNDRDIMGVHTNTKLSISTHRTLFQLAIVPDKEGVWKPAVSFGSEQAYAEAVEADAFTPAWHELLAQHHIE